MCGGEEIVRRILSSRAFCFHILFRTIFRKYDLALDKGAGFDNMKLAGVGMASGAVGWSVREVSLTNGSHSPSMSVLSWSSFQRRQIGS